MFDCWILGLLEIGAVTPYSQRPFKIDMEAQKNCIVGFWTRQQLKIKLARISLEKIQSVLASPSLLVGSQTGYATNNNCEPLIRQLPE